MATWLDACDLSVGEKGFLVQKSPEIGSAWYLLQNTPARTNQSHAPLIKGWCGTTNNVATFACGCAKVTKITKNGRALVSTITGSELREYLEECGWSELGETGRLKGIELQNRAFFVCPPNQGNREGRKSKTN